MQGWAKDEVTSDLRTEWREFGKELVVREQQGCFGKGESVSSVRRLLAERMTFPAGEALLFFYDFGDRGFVDLQPGMQVGLERPGPALEGGRRRPALPMEARYEVVALGATGVALRLEKTKRTQPPGAEVDMLFGGAGRFRSRPLLRLFLQSMGSDQAARDAVLIGAANESDLEDLTRQVAASGRGACPTEFKGEVSCVSFGSGTAVNLLLKLWINHRVAYRPLGTPLSYLIGTLPESEQATALETVRVARPMVRGGRAEISFPKTMEGAHDVILVSGDRVAWGR